MTESATAAGSQASEVLAPESGLVSDPDVAQLGDALGAAARGALSNPALVAAASIELAADLARIPLVAAARWLGGNVSPVVPLTKDRRFAHPAWSQNPTFFSLHQSYGAASRYARRLVDGAGLDDRRREKARLALDLLLDGAAPTNVLATNPAALARAYETGGASVGRGFTHFVQDAVTNGGRPRQVDTRPFRVGVNLAATRGKVVYRNELMELLQYEPQTPQVHATPLLLSPPWINKYYVMDLAPGRSFVEWAVRHGRTVFAISYRNPPAAPSEITMDDYLVHGPHRAFDVIAEITGAAKIDVVGLCLGGALTAIAAAHLAQTGDTRVGNVTLLNTLLDYSEPGALGAFTDPDSVERLERRMARTGHLPGSSMAQTFDVLRANDLIFNYVVSNWLMGQDPPAFDILAWNADATRMPARMHSFYLRNFYLHNRLARGELEIAGQRIDLAAIDRDVYVVSAENDHIVPWHSAYAGARLLGGRARFVLSSGGHIAGIVNPPGPKSWYLAGDATAADPKQWREGAQRHAGSWWEDWARWSSRHAGDLVDPPPMGSAEHPVLYDAPGEYVHS